MNNEEIKMFCLAGDVLPSSNITTINNKPASTPSIIILRFGEHNLFDCVNA